MKVRLSALAALACALVALPVVAHSQTAAPDETATDSTGADFFRTAILSDARATAAVKKGLKSNALFIDPASQYGDLTGDGKPDAAVRVDSGGAAGAVAVYVFSAEGSKAGKLRIVYRNQQQYRVTTKVLNGAMTLTSPVWAKGDDVCCPTKLREVDYVWDATARTMKRDGPSRTVNVATTAAADGARSRA